VNHPIESDLSSWVSVFFVDCLPDDATEIATGLLSQMTTLIDPLTSGMMLARMSTQLLPELLEPVCDEGFSFTFRLFNNQELLSVFIKKFRIKVLKRDKEPHFFE
jgi:hypothetical protein